MTYSRLKPPRPYGEFLYPKTTDAPHSVGTFKN